MRSRLTPAALAAGLTALVLGLAACGGSSGSAADDPYGLAEPGVLRVGTLTDAPPNVYLEDGEFTGFDNDLLRAVAAKAGLEVEFVGTDFSALLSQVANGRFDVGSSSITITQARQETVDFTNGYDFGYFGLVVPAGGSVSGFDALEGTRAVVVQGTVQDDFATKAELDPVRVPDYNAALNQLRTGTADAWIAPAEIGEKSAAESGGRVELVETQLGSQPTAFAVAKEDAALREALNKGLDAVIGDGTWSRLQEQYYPSREIPADFVPGSGEVAVPAAGAAG